MGTKPILVDNVYAKPRNIYTQYCDWCEVAEADVEYVFSEPIQLNLLHKVVIAMNLCAYCLDIVTVAEEYALVS